MIVPVESVPYTKYEGLTELGSLYKEEPACVKIYQKPSAAALMF